MARLPARLREALVLRTVDGLTQAVVRALMRSRPSGGTFHIEDVQDQVELGLMRGGHHEIARAYVLYREKHNQERAKQLQAQAPAAPLLHVTDGGKRVALDIRNLQALIEASCANLGADVKPDPIVSETMRNLYDGVPIEEVYKASILAARTLIEKDPDYTYATARLLLHTIVREVLGRGVQPAEMQAAYTAGQEALKSGDFTAYDQAQKRLDAKAPTKKADPSLAMDSSVVSKAREIAPVGSVPAARPSTSPAPA